MNCVVTSMPWIQPPCMCSWTQFRFIAIVSRYLYFGTFLCRLCVIHSVSNMSALLRIFSSSNSAGGNRIVISSRNASNVAWKRQVNWVSYWSIVSPAVPRLALHLLLRLHCVEFGRSSDVGQMLVVLLEVQMWNMWQELNACFHQMMFRHCS
jgi:hypothetical protein